MKDIVGALKDQFFYEAPEELWKDMVEAGKTMSVLAGLVQFFADAFEEKKRSKHLIDFSDMEQYALRILTEKTEEGLIPSEAAKDYQKKFAEVMIDEYQDSNLIQERFSQVSLRCQKATITCLWWEMSNRVFTVSVFPDRNCLWKNLTHIV